MRTAFSALFCFTYLFAAGVGLFAIWKSWCGHLFKALASLPLAAGTVVLTTLVGLHNPAWITPYYGRNDMPGFGAVLLASFALMYLAACLLVAVVVRRIRNLDRFRTEKTRELR